jgi:hypothetical protein
MSNRGRLLIPAMATVLLASGCAATVSGVASPTGSATSSTSSAADRRPVGIPAGVVGTAPVTAVGGGVLGTVEFRSNGIDIEMDPPATQLGDPAQIEWTLADSPFSPTACGSDNVWEIGFPQNDLTAAHLTADMFPDGDPSFFTDVVVVRIDPTPNAKGCSQPILATGPITWSIPVQRPLVDPKDHGAGTGAKGTITGTAASPKLYTTMAGDAWSRIADRFGISVDDLTWLNPNRLGGSAPGEAYAQQLLNLDPAHRGNSESRRPH